MRLASYIESQQSRKTAALIVKHGRKLGLLLFVLGLVYLGMLPNEELNRKAFFDENALMTGLVKREFRSQKSITNLASELHDIADGSDEVLFWIQDQLSGLDLEVYHQNFTAIKPVSFHTESAHVSGSNIYGILRAGRARSAESIILSVPYLVDGNDHGIALMLALADYFRSKNYWAKDIIFLVTTNGEIGMQAWIDAYMGTTTTGIRAAPLQGRSGTIQSVINVEVPSSSIRHADIIAEGVNGILPNLDLVYVVLRLCELENIPTAFHLNWDATSHYAKLSPSEKHLRALQTVLAVAAHQAPGLPTGNHALFLRHRIDSLTIRGVESSSNNPKSLHNLARALEGIFRSVNNLLEVLHHSEFFYFTSSRQRFISIGQYMPPFGFLLAPIIIEALSQWLLARIPDLLGNIQMKDNTGIPVAVPFPFQAVMKLLLVSFTSGLLLYTVPSLASIVQHPLKADGLVASLLVTCGLSILIPICFRSLTDREGWRMAKAFGLLLLLLMLIALAMMNFSLAVLLTVALVAPAVIAQPYGVGGRVAHLLRLAVTLLFTPPLCAFYYCWIYNFYFNSSPSDTIIDTASTTLRASLEGVVFAYNSWYFVGSWLYLVSCSLVWPMWLTSWILSCQRVGERPHPHSD